MITETTISVAPFDGLEVTDGFTVTVTIGPRESVVVRADERLLDAVDARVEGTTLVLGTTRERGRRTLEASISVPALARILAARGSSVRIAGRVEAGLLEVTCSGSSEVSADLRVDAGEVVLSGASVVTLSGTAGRLRATASGASHLRAGGLTVDELTIDVTGASTGEAAVTRTLSASASGASMVRYVGTPEILRSATSGASTIRPA